MKQYRFLRKTSSLKPVVEYFNYGMEEMFRNFCKVMLARDEWVRNEEDYHSGYSRTYKYIWYGMAIGGVAYGMYDQTRKHKVDNKRVALGGVLGGIQGFALGWAHPIAFPIIITTGAAFGVLMAISEIMQNNKVKIKL